MGEELGFRPVGRRTALFGVLAVVLTAVLAPTQTASASTVRTVGPGQLIQDAIDASSAGDVVEVLPGTYSELIDFGGRNIVVRSTGGPAVTTIHGNRDGRVVTFTGGEGPAAVLEGFRLTGGDTRPVAGAGGDGGGIFVNGSSPTIRGNVIDGNLACNGGGIAVAFGSPTIVDNVIRDNHRVGCTGGTGGGGILVRGAGQTAIRGNEISDNSTGSDGGGIALFAAGTPDIVDNVIQRNTAAFDGGGVSLVNVSDARITQNLVRDNAGRNGGGIAWRVPSSGAGPRLTNNTVVANTASVAGPGIYAAGFQDGVRVTNNVVVATSGSAVVCDGTSGTPVFSANDFWSHDGQGFSGGCTDPIGTAGNISADPLLAPSGWPVPQPGSPLIDAGDSNVEVGTLDLAGNPRLVDGTGDGTARIDIGAFEAGVTVPSAPQNLAATHGKGRSVDVSWSPPISTGGSPLTGYTVRVVETGQTVSVGASTTSTTLNGISKGSALTIEVRAVNAIGAGPPATVTLGDEGGDGGGGKPCHPKKGC